MGKGKAYPDKIRQFCEKQTGTLQEVFKSTQKYCINAKKAVVSYSTVKRWRPDCERSPAGRPRIFESPACTDKLKALIKDAGGEGTLDQLVRKNEETARLDCSRSTLHRLLKENPDIKYVSPYTKANTKPENSEDRKQWAKVNKGRDWSKVHFQDEKIWTLRGIQVSKVYVVAGDTDRKTKKKPERVSGYLHCWGCINRSGKAGLTITRKPLDRKQHITNVRRHIPHGDVVLVDNHGAHKSRVAVAEIAEQRITTLLLPARSPDLNPIENVWGRMKSIVYKDNRVYSDLDVLQKAVEDAWKAVCKDRCYFANLADSMPSRCERVIQSCGSYIDV